MYSLIGLALGAGGAAGLYSSWRGTVLAGPWIVAGSWLLAAASLWAWSRGHGVEFGLGFGLIAFSLCGGLLVLLNFELRQRRREPDGSTQAVAIDPRSWGRHLLLFLLVVPLSGAAAIFATVSLCSLLPWQAANEMALAVYLVPLTWGLGAWWACADPRPLRPAAALSLLAAIPALFVYL